MSDRDDVMRFRAQVESSFDRWLAEHDREIAAKAWHEGAQWAAVECGVIRHESSAWATDDDNPYKQTTE